MTCFLSEVIDGDTYGGEALTCAYARTAIPGEWLEEYGRKIEGKIQVSLGRMDAIDRSPWIQ